MIAYLLAKEKEEDERDAAKRDKHKKEALKYREHLMAQMAKASALHATVTRPIHAAVELRNRAFPSARPFPLVVGTHAALRYPAALPLQNEALKEKEPGEGPSRCEREG
jgi:hypothetical protein